MAVSAISKAVVHMLDNSKRDSFYMSLTVQQVDQLLHRIRKIAEEAEARKGLMPYVKSALRVFEAEAVSMLKITNYVRCPTNEPCSLYDAAIPYMDYQKQIVPLLDTATNLQDHMQELPSTPTLLLVPSYEWYGLTLLHCSSAGELVQPRAWWTCTNMSTQERNDLNARAEQMLKKSLDRRAGRAVSIFHLALALDAQGKADEAKDIYAKYLERMRLAREDVHIRYARKFVAQHSERQSRTMLAPTVGVKMFQGQDVTNKNVIRIVGVMLAGVALITAMVVVVAHRKRRSCTGGGLPYVSMTT